MIADELFLWCIVVLFGGGWLWFVTRHFKEHWVARRWALFADGSLYWTGLIAGYVCWEAGLKLIQV